MEGKKRGLKRLKLSLSIIVAGACLSVSPIKANATQIVRYLGKPVTIILSKNETRSITFPFRFSKIITGINTQNLSVEQSNKTLFLKPLSTKMQGDFFVVENNGTIVHFFLKTLKSRTNLDDISVVFPQIQAQKAVESARKMTPLLFLKRLALKKYNGIDQEKPDAQINIHLNKFLTVKIVRIYETPIYKAYYGYVYNNSETKLRIPVEQIYYKGLIGVSPGRLYLQPHSKTDIYFITYKG